MKRPAGAVRAVLSLAFAWVGIVGTAAAAEPATVASTIGPEATAALQSFVAVKAFRLRHESYQDSLSATPPAPEQLFHEYRIIRTIEKVDADLARAFSAELLNTSDYYIPLNSACFDPGLGLRFLPSTGGAPVDVLVCLDCNGFAVESATPSDAIGFDGAHNVLLRLAKRLFPADEGLAGVDEEPSPLPEVSRALKAAGPVRYKVPASKHPPRAARAGTLSAVARASLQEILDGQTDAREGPCPVAATGKVISLNLGTMKRALWVTFDFRRNRMNLERPTDYSMRDYCLTPVRQRLLRTLVTLAPTNPAIAALDGE